MRKQEESGGSQNGGETLPEGEEVRTRKLGAVVQRRVSEQDIGTVTAAYNKNMTTRISIGWETDDDRRATLRGGAHLLEVEIMSPGSGKATLLRSMLNACFPEQT